MYELFEKVHKGSLVIEHLSTFPPVQQAGEDESEMGGLKAHDFCIKISRIELLWGHPEQFRSWLMPGEVLGNRVNSQCSTLNAQLCSFDSSSC